MGQQAQQAFQSQDPYIVFPLRGLFYRSDIPDFPVTF